MENNISNLIHEREMINSRMKRMIYGSIEIREKSNNRYIYMFIEGLMRLSCTLVYLFASKALFYFYQKT